jgi:hypothetical protein
LIIFEPDPPSFSGKFLYRAAQRKLTTIVGFEGLLQSMDEVIGMFTPHILDAKIINNQGEFHGPRLVFPEACCELCLVVSVHRQAARQELFCQDTCPGPAIHAFLNLNTDVSIRDQGQLVKLCNNFLWDRLDRYVEVLK